MARTDSVGGNSRLSPEWRAVTYFPTGSGDTTLSYIEEFCFVVIALAATLIWSGFDRQRGNYATLHRWLRLAVRYHLAFTLFSYGFAKVFPLQFRTPGFARLLERYGDFSPMGSLWWFMGASTAYIVFAGVCEVIPGILLLFRRTTTLGALAAFAVLTNVAALNYCYDVPVKLYSTNLVLMALFLAAPDAKRLMRVLVLNRAVEPCDEYAIQFPWRWARIAAIALAVLFPGFQLFGHVTGGWRAYKQAYVSPARPPLYGLWEVETFIRGEKEVAPLLGDASRWRWLMVEVPGRVAVQTMDEQTSFYNSQYDTGASKVTLNGNALTYSRPDNDHLTLEGNFQAAPVLIRMKRVNVRERFLLLNRGFHWVNELPFNK